jgi:hypothetical protein
MAGFIFDQTGTYQTGFIVLVLMSMVGLFMVTLLRPVKI